MLNDDSDQVTCPIFFDRGVMQIHVETFAVTVFASICCYITLRIFKATNYNKTNTKQFEYIRTVKNSRPKQQNYKKTTSSIQMLLNSHENSPQNPSKINIVYRC